MATFTRVLKNLRGDELQEALAAYPIFEESYRDSLNQKIIDHYWNQEIGQETVSMFTFALKRKMNEIMPLYNQQYVLSLLEIDPLSTMSISNITEMDSTGNTTGTSESGSVSKAKSRGVASDTPQTQLSDNQDYATAIQDNISETDATGTANDVQETLQTGKNDSKTTGYQGHAPLLILQARQALVNVDMMVIAELQELFMLLWHNDDSFTGQTLRGSYYGRY